MPFFVRFFGEISTPLSASEEDEGEEDAEELEDSISSSSGSPGAKGRVRTLPLSPLKQTEQVGIGRPSSPCVQELELVKPLRQGLRGDVWQAQRFERPRSELRSPAPSSKVPDRRIGFSRPTTVKALRSSVSSALQSVAQWCECKAT